MYHEVQPASAVRPVPHDQLKNYEIRLVVAGSRSFNDYIHFSTELEEHIRQYGDRRIVFISGMAQDGADAMVVRWCKENDHDWAEFPAKWDDLDAPGAVIKTNRFGNDYNVLAGFARNNEMRDVGTDLLCFWDSKSPGTLHMLVGFSKKHGKGHTTLVLVGL